MVNLILWNTLGTYNSIVRPVSCHELASWLRQHGYTVKVIDYCALMTTEDLVSITEKYIGSETLAIGVSSTFWNPIEEMLNKPIEPQWVINARSKLQNKKLYWLLGGAQSGVNEGRIFDWIKFHEYSEDSLLKWMDQNSSKLIRRELFDIHNSRVSFLDDFIRPHEVLSYEMARGCQFKCKFCNYALIGKKKGTYIKDSNIVREDFIRNYNEFGVTRYWILDDTVNESLEKIIDLADIAQSLPFEVEWVGFTRLDLIWSRPETIQILKDSGMKSTVFGIESFHPKASMSIGKGWNGKHAKDFLLRLKDEWKDDITWTLAFITGLPGETQESLDETAKWCVDNKMYDWFWNFLFMSRRPDKMFKSEFETDYAKFGYSFEGDSHIEWKNDLWTRTTAEAYTKHLNHISYPYRSISGFTLSRYSSLGYSFKELTRMHIGKITESELRLKTLKFVNEYVQYQLR